MAEIKSTNERVLESLNSGEYERRLAARELADQERTAERNNAAERTRKRVQLIDDSHLPDALAHGYLVRVGNVDPKEIVVRIMPDADKYNGIDSVLITNNYCVTDGHIFTRVTSFPAFEKTVLPHTDRLFPAPVIPIQFCQQLMASSLAKTGKITNMDTDAERVKAIADALTNHYLPAHIGLNPQLNVTFNEMLEEVGYSNRHVPAMKIKAAQCYDASALLAGMVRTAGIPARIVYFSEPTPEQWKTACDTLGEFTVQGDPDIMNMLMAKGCIPDYVAHAIAREFPDANEIQVRELGQEYMRHKRGIRLDPTDDTARKNYCHYWVQAKVEDGWTTYNTTKPGFSEELLPDPVMDTIFDIVQPTAQLALELRVVPDGDDVRCYFKETESF